MNGFVQNLEDKDPGKGHSAMQAFSNDSAPILNTLANEFAVFDNWHAALPGPTGKI